MWGFVIDQLLHLGILVAISTVYETEQYPHKVDSGKYQVGESESCDNIKNAGALIGNLERMLTIVFVILGQFEAIGFIVADKSILRFKDTDTAKTEYVLAGTFLSFGIAILFGLMVTM